MMEEPRNRWIFGWKWIFGLDPLLPPIPQGRCSSIVSPTLLSSSQSSNLHHFLAPFPHLSPPGVGDPMCYIQMNPIPRAQGALSLLPAGKGKFAEDGRAPSVEMAPGVSNAGKLSGNPQYALYLQQHSFPESFQFLFFLPIKTK